MDAASLTFGNCQLLWFGADARFGTADDRVITNATVTYRENLNAGVRGFYAAVNLFR